MAHRPGPSRRAMGGGAPRQPARPRRRQRLRGASVAHPQRHLRCGSHQPHQRRPLHGRTGHGRRGMDALARTDAGAVRHRAAPGRLNAAIIAAASAAPSA